MTLLARVEITGEDYFLNANHATSQKFHAIRNEHVKANRLFEDADFPANAASIDGEDNSAAASSSSSANNNNNNNTTSLVTPKCMCGVDAKRAVVSRDTPNKGRPYYACANTSKKCGFFTWADGKGDNNRSNFGSRPIGRDLTWSRLPHLPVVSDAGFSAKELRQGGVGDCWALSAIAVVAERHDLIARLFVDTVAKKAGCYAIRLFLDGEWKTLLIDDRLPVSKSPRRTDLAFDSKLAFARSGDGASQNLWASLLEKAYAKAHGSYKAISGGHIAEALLDLTGCPTVTIAFDARDFDSELLWLRLSEFRRLELPMGCATAGDSGLRGTGLVGNHAYSILDVVTVQTAPAATLAACVGGPQPASLVGGEKRLVRIRNPHGIGEWNGEWSDNSAQWANVIAASRVGGSAHMERTGVNDGTFWMDFTHFQMAFCLVDVCLAHRGWNSRSVPNFFPVTADKNLRVCGKVLKMRVAKPTTMYVLALQPTPRGKWCREDRSKSYRLGDLSVLIVRLSSDGKVLDVVGGGLRGLESCTRGAFGAEMEPGSEYAVVPLCLGQQPTAGETRTQQPFSLRVFTSEPVLAEVHDGASAGGMAVEAMHMALGRLGFARSNEVSEVAMLSRLRRRVQSLGDEVSMLVVHGDGVIVYLAANNSGEEVEVEIKAMVKSHIARASGGLVANDAAEAAAYTERRRAVEGPQEQQRGGPRWPAKWKCLTVRRIIPPRSQAVVAIVVRSGTQAELGEVEITAKPAAAAAAAPTTKTTTPSIFEARPLSEAVVAATRGEAATEDKQMEAAIAASIAASLVAGEEKEMEAAIAASLADGGGVNEEKDVEAAIAASLVDGRRSHQVDVVDLLTPPPRHQADMVDLLEPPRHQVDVVDLVDDDDDDDDPPPAPSNTTANERELRAAAAERRMRM